MLSSQAPTKNGDINENIDIIGKVYIMTQSEERKSGRKRQIVYDEIVNEAKDIKSKPLTIEELRQRLKHIAGLCWGLSVDLANELEEREKLKFENKKLLQKIEKLNSELALYRNRENARNRRLKKTEVKKEK